MLRNKIVFAIAITCAFLHVIDSLPVKKEKKGSKARTLTQTGDESSSPSEPASAGISTSVAQQTAGSYFSPSHFSPSTKTFVCIVTVF